jgi:hypothetical protein
MARSFNGSSDRILVGIKSALQPTNVSVAAWFNPTATTDGQTVIGYDKSAGQSYMLGIGVVTAGNAVFLSFNGGWYSAHGLVSLLAAGAWNHMIGTYDGTTMRLYVNGTVTGTTAALPSIDYTMGAGEGLTIGYYGNNGTPANYYTGDVAECAVWDAALSQGEISALARGYSPKLIRPAAILEYLPLWGRTSPELGIVNGFTGALNGTGNVAHPRVIMSSGRKHRKMTTAAVGGGFQAAWARGANTVIGAGARMA